MNFKTLLDAIENLTATELQNLITEAQGLAARVRNVNLDRGTRTAALQRIREIESETGLELYEAYNANPQPLEVG